MTMRWNFLIILGTCIAIIYAVNDGTLYAQNDVTFALPKTGLASNIFFVLFLRWMHENSKLSPVDFL